MSQIIYFSTEINLPNLLFPSSWPYLKLIFPCWFEFWLDYHVNSVEWKWNEQQLSSQASPSGERSEHETCCKMEEFAFDSIHCCLPTSISMLGNLKLEKNFMKNKSYNTRDKFAFKLRETMQLWVVFFVNILADFFVTRGWKINLEVNGHRWHYQAVCGATTNNNFL